jgi:ABC-type nitrate/sulfonate/bicarbonate transport system permease component
VPILGYLSFTVVFFISLFPGNTLGPELAAIFAIFTSQAWNMAFSFYQALRTVPRDLDEASRSFRASAWQRFWRLEVPFAMPGLVWNMMMSMSGGWFFVVAAEAIAVGDIQIALPGVGSYVARAIQERDLAAVGWAIGAMTVAILLYDQLLFRPMVVWADKFRFEQTAAQIVPRSVVLDLFRRSRLFRRVAAPVGIGLHEAARARLAVPPAAHWPIRWSPPRQIVDLGWYGLLAMGLAVIGWQLGRYARAQLSWGDLTVAAGNGALTLLRVAVLIALASAIWVPVGVAVGLRPKLTEKVQPVAQFLAAFPANLLFPVAVFSDRALRSRAKDLAQSADDPRDPMVHPVQRDRRRQRLPERFQRSGGELSASSLALVAPRHASRDLPLLRHRRHHRLGRRLEREHRLGMGELGTAAAERVGPRRLHRADDAGGRLSADRTRHRRHVGAGDRDEPAALATALCLRRTPDPARLAARACRPLRRRR